jgi:alcohol dehydrogenase
MGAEQLWRFGNPVEIKFGAGAFETIATALRGRRWALVTYAHPPIFRSLADKLARQAGPPALVIDDVAANPDFVMLDGACRRWAESKETPEAIVALGGGSALDAAKVLAAAGGDFLRVRHHLETGRGADQLAFVPIIAVPTTAGTGSEVTCWATVWDNEGKRKFSLSHPRLFPETAIVDPDLTLAAPRALTIATGLDALSHALESIWNVHANPVSTTFAETAARTVMEVLPELAHDLENRRLRARMSEAALMAGLAFSNTRTALAHSLSYHVTLHHGVPHGIACSFSLPMVMRGAIGADPACDAALQRIFCADLAVGAQRLERFLERLDVSTDVTSYGVDARDWDKLVDAAFQGERGRNYIGRREALGDAA